MNLISVEAAIETIDRFNVCGYVEEPYEKLRDALQALPAIESERKTGRWLPDTRAFEMMFVCSECKASLHVDTINLKPSWDYCPNCGAYNGGEEDV